MKTILLLSILLVSCSSKQEQKKTKFIADPLESGCGAGKAKSCLALGQSAETTSPQKAQHWYEKACDFKEPLGCLSAGGLMLNDPAELPGALASFSKGCDLKEAAACYGAGIVESGVYGGKKNVAQARKYFQESCRLGLPDGCAQDPILQIENAQSEEEMMEARVALKHHCSQKISMACYSLGTHFRDLEPEQSRFWFEEGCELGDGSACLAAGFAHMSAAEAQKKVGKEGISSSEKSVSFFEKGCLVQEKDWVSCSLFAYSSYKSAHGEAEKEKAISLLKTVCENDSEGCFRMALIEEDPIWIAKACSMNAQRCELYKQFLLKKKTSTP